MQLAEQSWTAVDEMDVDAVLLPVGSTEQHGPHAPLGTDTLLAEEVSRRAAVQSTRQLLVAPPLPVGIAEEHRHFTGTLWLSPETFRATLNETITSIAYHGFSPVLIVNGHGGNVDAIAEVAARVTRDRDAYCVAFTWFQAVATGSEMGHAGAIETSALLSLSPELVDTDALEAASTGAVDRWGVWVDGVNLAYDTDEFAPNGVVGDPEHAGSERGETLLTEATDVLLDVIEAAIERA